MIEKKVQINMLVTKRFRQVHRRLKWSLFLLGSFLGARAFFVITEAHPLFVNDHNWARALLPMFVGLALAMVLGWSYRYWFKDGVPENDTTDMIDNQSYNKVGFQLVIAFYKGVGALVGALALLWIASLTVW